MLTCGGTRLNANDTTIFSEVVWNDPDGGATGGGISDEFPVPDYQEDAGIPPSANSSKNTGRGVPDVAANADPATGYPVRVDGEDVVAGGTSAVAPLWAGLVARLNQAIGKPVGFPQPDALRIRSTERSLSRHHRGEQRGILGGTRLGRLQRPRRCRRHETAAGTLEVNLYQPLD